MVSGSGVLALALWLSLAAGPQLCSARCQAGRLIRRNMLTAKDRYGILYKHNKLRQMVATGKIETQPEAVNMYQLRWDKELERLAQSWADRCVFQHPTKFQLARFRYGQNLYMSSGSPNTDSHLGGPDFSRAIQNWFDEVKTYGYNGSYNPSTGHYSQVIWGYTYLVGCGYVQYVNGGMYSKMYVCNYGPGGNMIGQLPYIYGPSACKPPAANASREFPGLCYGRGQSLHFSFYLLLLIPLSRLLFEF